MGISMYDMSFFKILSKKVGRNDKNYCVTFYGGHF